jgi:hypothetical protein
LVRYPLVAATMLHPPRMVPGIDEALDAIPNRACRARRWPGNERRWQRRRSRAKGEII